MNKVRNNIRKDFTIAPNSLINDNNLSVQARFVFIYMASKPDDWKFIQEPMAKSLGWSLPTLRKYIDELIQAGWMGRERIRVEGKFDSFDYTLHSEPSTKNLHLDQVQKIPTWQKTNLVNFSTTNKEEEQRKIETNNSISKSESEKIKTPTDWKEVAKLMLTHSQGEGKEDWEFMKAATGYSGNGAAIFSNWAAKNKDVPYVLANWKDHFPKLQSWMRNEARADLKAKPRPYTSPGDQPVPISPNTRVHKKKPTERWKPTPAEIEELRKTFGA